MLKLIQPQHIPVIHSISSANLRHLGSPDVLSRQTGKSVGILHDVVPSIRMSRQGQWDHSNSGS